MAARTFVEHGPYSFSELRVDPETSSFASYAAFIKSDLHKRYGRAAFDWEYHHVIPQVSDIPADRLNSTDMIIRLPKLVHQMVSEEWESLARNEGKSLSESLKGKSYTEQRAIGLNILHNLGILK
jgi:hypothetical protein